MARRLVLETINKLHYVLYNLVHTENHQCYNKGSNQHDDCTLDQLGSGWPGCLIPKFSIGLLKIRK